MSESAADRGAAIATGVGVGLIVLMVTWLVGNRITAVLVGPPVGPTVAICLAVVAGAITTVIMSRRLVASMADH
ncbi:MAG: hypothetical protein A2Z12_09895 [Actinobacteria bacterium RBG_16_68_21]|nr:MAG: hypothetical protein A2Z12_09895 [Actinobacteria bacterium RBG_16_68_21]